MNRAETATLAEALESIAELQAQVAKLEAESITEAELLELLPKVAQAIAEAIVTPMLDVLGRVVSVIEKASGRGPSS